MNTKQICSHSSTVEPTTYNCVMVGATPPESMSQHNLYLIEAYNRGYRVI